MTDETIWDQEPYNKAYEKCPAENCPEFKQCQMCQECHILKAWRAEKARENPSCYQKVLSFLSCAKYTAENLIGIILVPYYLIKIITTDHKR